MSIANRPSIRVFFHPRDVRDVALIQLNRRSDLDLALMSTMSLGAKLIAPIGWDERSAACNPIGKARAIAIAPNTRVT